MKRFSYIDFTKGICMLLIMYGHLVVSTYQNEFMNWSNSIKLTGFYYATSFVLASKPPKKTKEIIHKQSKSILLPYFTFSFLLFISDIILHSIKKQALSEVIITDLISTFSFKGISVLWYLPTVFVSVIVYNYLRKKPVFHYILGTLTSIIIFLAIYIFFPNLYELSYSKKLAIAIVSSITLFGAKSLFAIFTLLVSSKIFSWLKHLSIRKTFLIGIVLSILNLLLNYNNYKIDLNKLYLGNNFVAYILGSLIGGIGLIYLIKGCYEILKINKVKIVEYIGKNSLVIMGMHNSFAIILIIRKIFLLETINNSFLYTLLSILGLIMLGITQIIIVKIFNCSKLRILIGKSK